MSMMSNRYVRQLRRVARAMGVPRMLGRMQRDYEAALSRQLIGACRPGDVIWDVGANIGYYAPIFSEKVGPSGKVFAFEPGDDNVRRLRSACDSAPNVEIRAFGLSDKEERQRFLAGADTDQTTSRVLRADETVSGGVTEVELRTGDGIIADGAAELPNVVKIDVEGHELSVLSGMQRTLTDPRLRSVFVEVHFSVLDGSGRADHPQRIEDLLKRSGFKLKWTDASHIHAERG